MSYLRLFFHKALWVLGLFPSPVCLVDSYIQNKSPFAIALGDWISEVFLLISKASPNGQLAIIIVVIVGEAKVISH